MPSLADRSELVGFFSYSREDDEDSKGALSVLRDRIQRELRGQLGRSARDFRLWQDKEAIAPGRLWEAEIKTAIEQAVFFIPIVTLTGVRSSYCRIEFEAFLAREKALGRDDLIFPILYIRVPALEDAAQRQAEPVLAMIARRQYVDWREFRHRDVYSTPVGEAIEKLCGTIAEALSRPQPPEAELESRQAAEPEQRTQESEGDRQQQEKERQQQERLQLQADQPAAEHRRQQQPPARERPARDQQEAAARPPIGKSWRRPVVIASAAAAIVLIAVLALTAALAPRTLSTLVATFTPETPKPGETFRDCPDCPEMVWLPPGQFMMGTEVARESFDDERPRHAVTVRSVFAVGKYHVTRGEYAHFVQATAYRGAFGGCYWESPGFSQTERDPVVCVNWDDAKAYAAWLTRTTGKAYRLPTEAEWEYAARAGTTGARYWGEEIGRDNANCNGCGSRWDSKSTAPAGSFAPNGFGLSDMLGNAWQWIEDCWSDNYQGAPNGSMGARTLGDCTRRVVRGGSWRDNPLSVRAGHRIWYVTGFRDNSTGFRMARTRWRPGLLYYILTP